VFIVNCEFNVTSNASIRLPVLTGPDALTRYDIVVRLFFTVNSFVANSCELKVYRLKVPIYESGC
jgi:hypothetical protein